MNNFILGLIPIAAVGANIAAVVIILALVTRRTWGKEIINWLGKHALILGLIVSLSAILGSLFYSNVMHYTPCVLCWWQRVAIYPIFVLFLTALKKKDRGVFSYVWRLSVIAAVIALYNSYIQWGGNPLIPCDPNNPCSKLYVFKYGYLTIPTMSLSIAALLILLAIINKVYENRHA